MKHLVKVLMLIIWLFLQSESNFAQECTIPPNVEESSVEKVSKRNPENYKDWKKYTALDLTLYVPAALKDRGDKCYEGGCRSFENDKMYILITKDPFAPYPIRQKTYPGYSEKGLCINGRLAWYWFYPNNIEENRYHAGIYFYFDENPKRRLIIRFDFKDKDLNQVAEKIVKSVEVIK